MKSHNQNKNWFSREIEKNQGIIHKITLVYANNSVDREDLFQEICLQLWKSFPNFREDSKFSTWMYRVALNTAISNIRKGKNQIEYEQLNNYSQSQPDEETDYDNIRKLYTAISKLNRIDKAIILLWLEEKSYEEIASIIGTSKTNISVKLVRIRKKLEEIVSQELEQES